MNHKFNFQQSIADFNLEFSFSKTSCHTEIPEPSLLYHLLE